MFLFPVSQLSQQERAALCAIMKSMPEIIRQVDKKIKETRIINGLEKINNDISIWC